VHSTAEAAAKAALVFQLIKTAKILKIAKIAGIAKIDN